MASFFAQTMLASGLGYSAEGPVIGASVNQEKNFSFVEVRAMATPCGFCTTLTAGHACDLACAGSSGLPRTRLRAWRSTASASRACPCASAGPRTTSRRTPMVRCVGRRCAVVRAVLAGGPGPRLSLTCPPSIRSIRRCRLVLERHLEPGAGRPGQDLDRRPAVLLQRGAGQGALERVRRAPRLPPGARRHGPGRRASEKSPSRNPRDLVPFGRAVASDDGRDGALSRAARG